MMAVVSLFIIFGLCLTWGVLLLIARDRYGRRGIGWPLTAMGTTLLVSIFLFLPKASSDGISTLALMISVTVVVSILAVTGKNKTTIKPGE